MKISYLVVFFFVLSIMTGCGVGGWWMNGDPNFGRTPLTPEMMKWEKDVISDELRKNDWINCGGDEGGSVDFSAPSGNHYQDSVKADKEYDAAQACMLSKGYHYTGTCRGPIKRRYACKHKS